MNEKTKQERYEILIYGMKNGVSKACSEFGVSRTIYYRWLHRFEIKGIDGLNNVKKKMSSKNRLSHEIESEVFRLIKFHPDYGPQSIAWLLEERGFIVSESGVYNIMRRTNLSTRKERQKFANSNKNVSNEKEIQPKLCPLSKADPGDIWICWTTNLGSLPGIGRTYQYTVIDAKSRFTCARIYHNKNTDYALDVLQEVALPMAESLNVFPKVILTPKEQEYTSGRSFGSHRYTATLHGLGIRQLIWCSDYEKYLNAAECFSRLIHKEFYLKIFRKNPDFSKLYVSLQNYLRYYNFKFRPIRQGKPEKTPYEVIKPDNLEGITMPLWVFVNPLDI